MKIGTVRWKADIDDINGKIEFTELVLRSSSIRKKFRGITWFGGPRRVNFWIAKHKGVTWGKLSKSHGDWGWLPYIPEFCRYDELADDKQPGNPTKIGALRKLLADNRWYLKEWGDEFDPDFPEELPYGCKIKRIQAAIKRLTNRS